jgi:hypothetical protein
MTLIQSHDFGVFDTPMKEILCHLKTLVADILTALDFCHMSAQTDGPEHFAVSGLEMP